MRIHLDFVDTSFSLNGLRIIDVRNMMFWSIIRFLLKGIVTNKRLCSPTIGWVGRMRRLTLNLIKRLKFPLISGWSIVDSRTHWTNFMIPIIRSILILTSITKSNRRFLSIPTRIRMLTFPRMFPLSPNMMPTTSLMWYSNPTLCLINNMIFMFFWYFNSEIKILICTILYLNIMW